MPLVATLAAATEGFREVVLAATRVVGAAVFPELRGEAAFLEVASRVEADVVVGGIKRRIGWTGGPGARVARVERPSRETVMPPQKRSLPA